MSHKGTTIACQQISDAFGFVGMRFSTKNLVVCKLDSILIVCS